MPGGIVGEFPENFLGFVPGDPVLLGAAAKGVVMTLQLSVLGFGGAVALGTLVALLRVSPLAPLRWTGAGYVEFFRNTPLLVQLFFLFFGPIRFSSDTFESIFRAAAVGMALYHGAYVAEVIRGGLLGIDKGQTEAARSLGLSYLQTLRYVQLPQTFRATVPPLGNIGIALIKNTSLASTIGVAELLQGAEVVESRTFRAEEAFGAAVLIYLALTIPASLGVNWLERRLLIAR
jgi:His/Glu/Gln/Arg/opine family amino acid ABC transporter permease subunit